MAGKKNKILLLIYILVAIVGFLYLTFNDYGFIKYLKVKKEKEKVEREIDSIKVNTKKLEGEIDSLKRKEPAKIEKIAREKYGISRPNEVIIKVEEK